MSSQGNVTSEQTFQYDFFKTNVNFSFYDYLLSGKVYANFIRIEAGKGSITWETLIDGTLFLQGSKLLQYVMQRFSNLNANALTQNTEGLTKTN